MRGPLAWLVDRRIAAFQNDLVVKHYDEVQNIYRQMRGWRHDYHNHIQVMKAHLSTGKTEELNDYLNALDQDLTAVDTIIKSGNIMLDAILNSKLSLAAARKIKTNCKAVSPPDMKPSDIDLCVIVGNLMDNAIESCMKLEEDTRFIRVYIGVFKGQLYISVSNAAGPGLKRLGWRYLSAKSGSHGFGLLRVDSAVQKYGGYVNRQSEEGVFATEVMLPLS